MTRCVGAFRKPCLFLTDRVLCDRCWAVIEAVPVEVPLSVVARRFMPTKKVRQ